MCIIKKILKIGLIGIASLIALFVLVVGVLNVAKLVIYRDYYKAESNLCKNPGLNDGFVCQGIAAVDGSDLILVSGYMKGKDASRIYVTTLDSKSYYVSLDRDGKAYTGHAGGIAVSGDYAYIANGSKIYTFPLEDILNAKNGDVIDIGSGTKVNNKASFLYSDDKYLYVGTFMEPDSKPVEGHTYKTAEGTHNAICSVYSIDDLSKPVKVYSIRDYVQGICFTPDGKVVLSTSHGISSSVYYVYNFSDAIDSGFELDGAPVFYLDNLLYSISGPAMAEGLDYYNGDIITLTESASNKYIFGKLFFANDIVGLKI